MFEGSQFLGRTCAECIRYAWSDDGVLGKDRKHYPSVAACIEATGKKPWERVKGTVTPCFKCPKAQDVGYYGAEEVPEKVWQAVDYHDECAAVGHFPDDPIVRRHASIIAKAQKRHEKAEQSELLIRLMTMSVVKA